MWLPFPSLNVADHHTKVLWHVCVSGFIKEETVFLVTKHHPLNFEGNMVPTCHSSFLVHSEKVAESLYASLMCSHTRMNSAQQKSWPWLPLSDEDSIFLSKPYNPQRQFSPHCKAWTSQYAFEGTYVFCHSMGHKYLTCRKDSMSLNHWPYRALTSPWSQNTSPIPSYTFLTDGLLWATMKLEYNLCEYISHLFPDGLNKLLNMLQVTFLKIKSLMGSEKSLNRARKSPSWQHWL